MKVLNTKKSRERRKIKNEKNMKAQKISQAIKEFYTKLCSPHTQHQQRNERTIPNTVSEEVPEITISEIKLALKQLKNNKCAEKGSAEKC